MTNDQSTNPSCLHVFSYFVRVFVADNFFYTQNTGTTGHCSEIWSELRYRILVLRLLPSQGPYKTQGRKANAMKLAADGDHGFPTRQLV